MQLLYPECDDLATLGEKLIGKTVRELQRILPTWLHFGFVRRDDLTSWGEMAWKCQNGDDIIIVIVTPFYDDHIIKRLVV